MIHKIQAKIHYLPNYNYEKWGDLKYAHDTDSGFDVRACHDADFTLSPMEIKLIPLGIAIAPEEGFGYQVRPRSGNAVKLGLGFVNSIATIDMDYRGEVGVILINLSQSPVLIERGMRIGQIVVEPIYQFSLNKVESIDDLGHTIRQAGGFGSSGKS